MRRQGDWKFDEKYWSKEAVRAMTDELHAMGTKVMVSVWPSVDKRSENYYEMEQKALISTTDTGSIQTYEAPHMILTTTAIIRGAVQRWTANIRRNMSTYTVFGNIDFSYRLCP